MKARVVNFRGAYKQQPASNQVILMPETQNKQAAEKLVDKVVVWANPQGTEIKGRVSAAHGTKGCVRAIFEKGLPGQALGSEVQIQ